MEFISYTSISKTNFFCSLLHMKILIRKEWIAWSFTFENPDYLWLAGYSFYEQGYNARWKCIMRIGQHMSIFRSKKEK